MSLLAVSLVNVQAETSSGETPVNIQDTKAYRDQLKKGAKVCCRLMRKYKLNYVSDPSPGDFFYRHGVTQFEVDSIVNKIKSSKGRYVLWVRPYYKRIKGNFANQYDWRIPKFLFNTKVDYRPTGSEDGSYVIGQFNGNYRTVTLVHRRSRRFKGRLHIPVLDKAYVFDGRQCACGNPFVKDIEMDDLLRVKDLYTRFGKPSLRCKPHGKSKGRSGHWERWVYNKSFLTKEGVYSRFIFNIYISAKRPITRNEVSSFETSATSKSIDRNCATDPDAKTKQRWARNGKKRGSKRKTPRR
jgi:hypothetical protein